MNITMIKYCAFCKIRPSRTSLKIGTRAIPYCGEKECRIMYERIKNMREFRPKGPEPLVTDEMLEEMRREALQILEEERQKKQQEERRKQQAKEKAANAQKIKAVTK